MPTSSQDFPLSQCEKLFFFGLTGFVPIVLAGIVLRQHALGESFLLKSDGSTIYAENPLFSLVCL